MEQTTLPDDEWYGYITDSCSTPRTSALLKFAIEDRKIRNETIMDATRKRQSIMFYAATLFCNAYHYKILNSDGNCATDKMDESIMIVVLLIAMEKVKKDTLPYGVQLRMDCVRKGLSITRDEWLWFASQDPSEEKNWKEQKFALFLTNPVCTALYCADLLTLLVSLPGKHPRLGYAIPEDIAKRYDGCWKSLENPQVPHTAKEIIEGMVMEFGPAAVGREQVANLKHLLTFLKYSSFYQDAAPSLPYMDHFGDLSRYICNMIWRLVNLASPDTEKKMGEVILTGVCYALHFIDLSKYKPTQDYVPAPDLLMGSEFKNLFLASSYLGNALTESTISAITTYAGCAGNPQYGYIAEWTNEPLGLYLHLAIVLATMYDNLQGRTINQNA